MARLQATLISVLLLSAALSPVRAELFSRSYVFKPGVTLEIGADAGSGFRLDSVEFILPSSDGRRLLPIGGQAKAEVTIANKAEASQKVGIAIAVHDDEGRLLAVASGGSKLLAIKPDRRSTYILTFHDVNSEIGRATSFTISIEPR